MNPIEKISFGHADQRRFAALSGDFNPVHLDAVEARRVVAGEPIVHGIHLLARVLNARGLELPRTRPIRLTARFVRPVVVGDQLTVVRKNANQYAYAVTLPTGQAVLDVTITEAGTETATRIAEPARKLLRAGRVPVVMAIADAADASGSTRVPRAHSAAAAFPAATRRLGADAVATILAISRLVGMDCPGRDSLLSSIDVRIGDRTGATNLEWRVVRTDPRFGLVRMAVLGAAVRGTVDAFFRPSGATRPDFTGLRSRVIQREFDGQRALIIGGSRGLGAATAAIVASGGGAALVTFSSGRSEATRLKHAGTNSGCRVDMRHFDVTADSFDTLVRACRQFKPTHVYYFATPRIFVRRSESFEPDLFQRFTHFYVTGFARVCEVVRKCQAHAIVLYPSSVAVAADDAANVPEYSAAKAAGERLAQSLDDAAAGFRVTVVRFPRITTDQTATLLQAESVDPIDAMLPVVRQMHQASPVSAP